LSEGRMYIQFFFLTSLNPFTIVYFMALITGNGSGLGLLLAKDDPLHIGYRIGVIELAIVAGLHRCHSERVLLTEVPYGHHHPG
jgi:hypothetical protein